jgi:hypothetical protein
MGGAEGSVVVVGASCAHACADAAHPTIGAKSTTARTKGALDRLVFIGSLTAR